MFTRLWIFEIILYSMLAIVGPVMSTSPQTTTTCEEFERDAYFDPRQIVDSMWKIIYFWSDTTEVTPVIFSLVEKKVNNTTIHLIYIL